MRNLFKLICLCFTASLLLVAVKSSCAQQADTQVVVKQVITAPVVKKQLQMTREYRRGTVIGDS